MRSLSSRLALVLLLLVWTATGLARPGIERRSKRKSSAPLTKPAKLAPAGPHEYRFDALRFAGQLSGPHALITRGRRRATRPPLHKLRRSFVLRIFETVEAPALHR